MRTLLCVTLLVGLAVANEFVIHFDSFSDCDSGDRMNEGKEDGRTFMQNNKYRVLYAKLYWVDNAGKITGIVSCAVPGSPTCQNSKDGSFKGTSYLFLAVTIRASASSFEDQDIHYQYDNDKDFKLSKVSAPTNTASDIHNLNNFVYVKTASYTGKGGAPAVTFTGGDCKRNRAKSLISGHGYFITKTSGGDGWHNMYYEPQEVGQYIFTP